MQTLWQDFRYALRLLAKSPAFTAVAVLTLALGIGANTAIFTLINALLLRDLPVRDPEQLVQLSAVRQGNKIPFSYPMFREVERGQQVLSGLMAWDTGGLSNIEVNGVLSQKHVFSVTGNAYSDLGATPLLGRLLTPQDADLSGVDIQVAVIGFEFWQGQFGGTTRSRRQADSHRRPSLHRCWRHAQVVHGPDSRRAAGNHCSHHGHAAYLEPEI